MKTLTDKNFVEEVERSRGPYLVEFSGYYCGACRSIRTLLAKVADQEGVPFGEIDVTTSIRTAAKYGIKKVPTTIMFKDGHVTQRQEGPVNIAKLILREE